jgi:hypothetical protein
MPPPSYEQTVQFFQKNKSFFTAPLTDQKTFAAVYYDTDTKAAIADYSDKLKKLLYKNYHEVKTEKGHVERHPLIYYWKKGTFDVPLQNDHIRQFIMDNQTHPAIKIWERHVICTLSGIDESIIILGTINDYLRPSHTIPKIIQFHAALKSMMLAYIAGNITQDEFNAKRTAVCTPSFNRMIDEAKGKAKQLEIAGFNQAYGRLATQITQLEAKENNEAAQAAHELCTRLKIIYATFLAGQLDSEDFVIKCGKALQQAEVSVLSEYSPFEAVLNAFVVVLTLILTLGIVEYMKGGFSILDADTIKPVKNISASLRLFESSAPHQETTSDEPVRNTKCL